MPRFKTEVEGLRFTIDIGDAATEEGVWIRVMAAGRIILEQSVSAAAAPPEKETHG